MNIVAYELLAALIAVVALCLHWLKNARIVHYIDSTLALACVVRGFSRKEDLSLIAGQLWYEMADLNIHYRAEYVASKKNLADGPSWGDLSLMRAVGADEVLDWKWPSFEGGLGGWMSCTTDALRAIVS